jgi:hypothetical protein
MQTLWHREARKNFSADAEDDARKTRRWRQPECESEPNRSPNELQVHAISFAFTVLNAFGASGHDSKSNA